MRNLDFGLEKCWKFFQGTRLIRDLMAVFFFSFGLNPKKNFRPSGEKQSQKNSPFGRLNTLFDTKTSYIQGCVGDFSARSAIFFLSFESIYGIFLFKKCSERRIFLGIGELLDFFFGLRKFSLGWKKNFGLRFLAEALNPKNKNVLWVQTLKKNTA